MHDIALVGNIVIDEVYGIKKWPYSAGTSNQFSWYRKSIGGIGNMVPVFRDYDSIFVEGRIGKEDKAFIQESFNSYPKIETRLHECESSSKAIILSDISKDERTSFVNWGSGIKHLETEVKAKWTHIAYLDVVGGKIKTPSDGIVSADLCLSDPTNSQKDNVLNSLWKVDYLFLSESEAQAYAPSPSLAARKLHLAAGSTIILHERARTILADEMGELIVINPAKELRGIDVLGAGDMYSAYFIEYLRTTGKDLIAAARFAHSQTQSALERRHNGQEI